MNSDFSTTTILRSEKGFALILTVFIISLATILVMNFTEETLQYQRSARNYTERIQADFILKSTLQLARVLLELPKEDGIKEDWLGDPWALIAAAPVLPISGFMGEPRLMIVDEAGKIDINAILGSGSSTSSSSSNPYATLQSQNSSQGSAAGDENSNFWKNVLRELFLQEGFVRQQYNDDTVRTLGNLSFDAEDQVAALHDWIDGDSISHSSASFPGDGVESSMDRTWFYNRKFSSLSELALVPGMTLERLARIAPFVRVSSGSNTRINVNTAPLEVLLALGFPEARAVEIVQERTNLPVTRELLQQLVTGDVQLNKFTTVSSREFSAYAMVRMPNVTRWAKAVISVVGGYRGRKATITSIEYL